MGDGSDEAAAPEAPEFDRAVDAFVAYVRVEAGLSPATLEAYARDLRTMVTRLAASGLRAPDDVTVDHLAAHVRWLGTDGGLDPRSIVRHLATMRVFFRWLHANTRIRRDPARLLERPTTWKRLPGTMTPGQMKRLVEAPSPETGALWLRDRAMLELMYAAGLRASEVGSVRLNQWFPTMSTVTVLGKGGKERMVPVGVPAARALTRWLETQRPDIVKGNEIQAGHRLFVSNRGKPLERVAVWGLVKKYAAVAGLHDVHPHVLRHSFATDLLRGGCDLRTVQEFLGHAMVVTTQIYTHVDKSRLRDTVRRFHPRFDR